MKLRLKLNTRMMLFILATSLVIYGISIGYISLSLKRQTLRNTITMADNNAMQNARQVKTNLEQYLVTARNLKQIFENYDLVPEKKRRVLFSETIIKVLMQNNDFISIWTIWEPNTIDNFDAMLINTPGNTFKGNFSPTYYKKGNQVLLQENTSTVLFQGEYYTIPKNTRSETLLNPFYYSYTNDTNDKVLQTNIIEPIIKNGNFKGVIGVDVPLQTFKNMIDGIKPFGTGYAYLVANNGVFVAHADTKLIEKNITEFLTGDIDKNKISENIKNGKKFSLYAYDSFLKQNCYMSFAPVFVGNAPTPWSFAVIVPQRTLIETSNRNFYYNIFVGMAGLIILTLIITFISKSIVTPVVRTTRLLQEMSQGEIDVSKINKIQTSDEIGSLNLAINELIINLNKTIEFANKIGEGDLKAEFVSLGDEDILGQSLIEMRNNLINAQMLEQEKKIEDDKRNWVTQGLAKFGEILREHSDNLEALAHSVAENLADYAKTAQCGIFIVNDDNPEEVFFDLASVVAYGRRKLFDARVYTGEGLIGRAADEKITIYIPQAPPDYVYIVQGLSIAENPRSVLIVPLNLNDYIYGVLEIVSFTPFEPYQIEFIEKLGESIASTIASIKVNQRTERLLSQSRKLEDELAQQEEEMRQNLEEMQATQEETAKREAELRSILAAINVITLVAELDIDGTVIKINEKLAQSYGSTPEMMIGKLIDEVIVKTEEEQNQLKSIFDSLHEGMQQKCLRHMQFHTRELWLEEHYNPVMEYDDLKRIILIVIDITEDKLLEKQIRALEEEIKVLETQKKI